MTYSFLNSIVPLVKNPPATQKTHFDSCVRKILWRRDRLPAPVFLGFPCGSAGKESTCSAGGLGSIPGLGRSPGEGKGYPLQYSGLENSMGCTVHGSQRIRHNCVTFTSTYICNFMCIYIYIYIYIQFMCIRNNNWTLLCRLLLGFRPSRPFQGTEKGNIMCVFLHTHINILYINTYLHNIKHEFT